MSSMTADGAALRRRPSVSVSLAAPCLVLDRTFQPIHVTSLRRAFVLLYRGVAQAIDEKFRLFDFESWAALSAASGDSIGTPSRRIRVPWVIVLMALDRNPGMEVRFSRQNVFLRDENTCQYCGRTLPRSQLNLDHVIPRSQGGATTWENVVCSCIACNLKKGGRTPEQAGMRLLRKPFRPRWNPVLRSGKPSAFESWKPFLLPVGAPHRNGAED
mgnify:CR=1 FL=1